MQVDQLSRLMQLQALQGTSNSNSSLGTGSESLIFNNLLEKMLENQSKEKSTTSKSSSTANTSSKKSSTSSLNSVTKELELMMQLQALQSISSSYRSVDSIASGDSNSNLSSGLGTSNYAYQIMNGLSQGFDSSEDSSSSTLSQNTNDLGSSSFL